MGNSKVKVLGQIYTPREVILDMLKLSKVNLKTVGTIIEPSAGQGAILDVLLDEMGEDLFYARVTAIELDAGNIKVLKKKFPRLTILEGNTILMTGMKADLIIGNPPYVRIHNIDEITKSFINKNFDMCKGMYDLYVAFYEWSILHSNRHVLFIAPNSWINSINNTYMRDYFTGNRIVKHIKNNKSNKVFSDAATYTAIVHIDKQHNEKGRYEWEHEEREAIGIFKDIRNGISTNLDSVFIADDLPDEPIVKPAYKASTGVYSKIIYPYDSQGKVIPFGEIQESSPLCAEILASNKDALLKRSLGKTTKWYEFARSQGLKHMYGEKVAVNNMVYKNRMKVKELGAEVVVYSGLFVANTSNIDIDIEDVISYLKPRSSSKGGGALTFSAKIIKAY